MPQSRRAYLLVAFTAFCLAAASPRHPVTRVDVVTDRMHGVDIADPYRWLEDQQSPETRAWITAQNAHTRSILDAFPGRDRLRARLEELTGADPKTPPIARNGRYFFERWDPSRDRPVTVVQEGIDGRERVLIDPMQLSADGSVSVQIWNVTPDGGLVAYGVRKGGQDEEEVSFLDVDTGRLHADRLPLGVYYSVFVLPDKSGVLYSRRRAGGTRLLEHTFGKPVADDRELFGTGFTDRTLIWMDYSVDGRFAVAFADDNSRSRVYYMDRQAPANGFVPLITDVNASFSGRMGGHTLFLSTTWEAPNGRVLAIDLENPSRNKLREVIPASPDSVLTIMRPAGHRIVANYLHNVATRLSVFEVDGKWVRDIQMPTLGTGYFTRPQWESDEIFYSFQSPSQPPTLYRYDLASGQQSEWSRAKGPANLTDIEVTQVWTRSKDGTRVPMFLAMKKGTKRDGNRPVYLTGYGGYGSITRPYYSPEAALWAKDGGIFALAIIRGGGEFGEKWHRAGKLESKQNSFDDFIAAAEWLVANKYSRPARMAIEGGSNGGMLVGVAAVQRPDLFRAVISLNPHLDMLRFHKFLKAAPWVNEYGNPDVAGDFAYLRKYSPYHHVRDGVRYPAMLFTTGDGDTRVAPLHARKMTARMQSASRSGLPVLLRYDLLAGHMQSGSRKDRLDEMTDRLAFLYAQLGMTP